MSLVPLVPFSPLVLCDQLLRLAREADRAGYRDAAGRLVALAHEACDPREKLGASTRNGRLAPARRRAPVRAFGVRMDDRACASGA